MATGSDPLEPLLAKDPRYAREAYHFVFEALSHTQEMLGIEEAATVEERHVSGQQLMEGVRQLAQEQFGLMARTVFHSWGIHNTVDFGQIVFNLVQSELMAATDNDTIDDFADVFDIDTALHQGYRITLDDDTP